MMKCGLILVSIVTLSLFSSVHPLCRVFKYITQYDSEDPTVLIADHLPLDVNNSIEFKVMPYVGNGHLAATIFNNQLYVNGLYNGEEGESHRARLPNIHRFRLISPQGDFLFKQYVLDMKNGNCIIITVDIETRSAMIITFFLLIELKEFLWNN